MKVILTTTLSSATETIQLEGNALTTPIDLEDLNAWIREFAQDNEVTESSVSYEVMPDITCEIVISDGTYTIGMIDGKPAEWDGNNVIPTEGTEIRFKNDGDTFGVNSQDEYIVEDGGWIENRYDKEMFEEMIRDWKADHSPEMDGLEIDSVELEDGAWTATAHDEKTTYTLTDDGNGNITIDYSGTR